MVSADPTSAPRMPASSASRLSPLVKKAQLKLVEMAPLSSSTVSQTSSRSDSLREASGVAKVMNRHAPGSATLADVSGMRTSPVS
jgi:hypothetical protein